MFIKKIYVLLLFVLLSVGNVSADDHNLTDTQLHAFLGIVTNFILSDGIVHNGTAYGTVTSPYTGNIWLDRNLGAKRVCTSFDDAQCYGDYYQWGRDADGHEKSSSGTVSIQETTLTPIHGNFIKGNTDWVDAYPTDDIMRAFHWSQRNGSRICPVGFRIPTIDELKAETLDNGVIDSDTAFSNFLKFPSAGLRSWQDNMVYEGLEGYVWTSTTRHDPRSSSIRFYDADSVVANIYRATGASVRCIKPVVATDEPPVVTLKSSENISVVQFGNYPSIGATAVDDVDGVLLVLQVGSVNMDVPDTYTVSFRAQDSAGQVSSKSVTVTVAPLMVTHNATTYGLVRSPYTGKIWLDRNLGASQVCTSFNDAQCYGDYYQWGRNFDGHQDSTSDTTSVKAADIGNAGTKFIMSSSDWSTGDSDGTIRQAQWVKTDGSTVCPTGFKVPNGPELMAETIDRDVTNSATAFSNFLKLPSAGYRKNSDGSMRERGSFGVVWVISLNGANSGYIDFSSVAAYGVQYDIRAYGQSVRCLKD